MDRIVNYFTITGGILLIFNSILLMLGNDNLDFIILILVGICSLTYLLFLLYRLLSFIKGVKIEIIDKKNYEIASIIFIIGYFFYLISSM